MRVQGILLITLVLGLWVPRGAATGVHEYRLENGLKVLVKEDHRAPVVVSQVWYKVGSSYEQEGTTGLSHLLEHMMFKGTKRYPAGEFSRLIAAHGGNKNAITSRDYTLYFQSLHKDLVGLSFALEADRMRGLLLSQDEFARERKVVMEERRLRTDDKPQALTQERLNAVAYLVSPYRHPVIGWMNDIENLEVSDARRWYDTWYVPNNATVVVVGDVQPEEVMALAKRHFGSLKPGKIPQGKPRREAEQTGMRRVVVKAPGEVPYLLMGYPVPSLVTLAGGTLAGGTFAGGTPTAQDWKPYALEVLAGVLDGGESARLARHLIRGSQVAASASAASNLYARLDELFLLGGVPAQGQSIAVLEQALREQIQALREALVEPSELARVKAQVVASAVYQQDSMFYQAMQIGTLETIGLGWQVMDEYVERVRAVTAEQVREVARAYLVDDRLTVAVFEPQPLPGGEEQKPQGEGVSHVR